MSCACQDPTKARSTGGEQPLFAILLVLCPTASIESSVRTVSDIQISPVTYVLNKGPNKSSKVESTPSWVLSTH